MFWFYFNMVDYHTEFFDEYIISYGITRRFRVLLKDYYRQFALPGLWKQIREIRHTVQELLADYDREVKNSATVAVSELVENAVKYGVSTPEMPQVSVEVEVVHNELAIRVSNGFDDPGSLRRLKEHMEQVTRDDPYTTMLKRLESLSQPSLGQPRDESMGLGIYRIAAEGRFALTIEVKEHMVTVIATRTVSEEE